MKNTDLEGARLREALFSIGIAAIEKPIVCMTGEAEKVIDQLKVSGSYEKKDGTKLNLFERAVRLISNGDGSIPNAVLLPESALVLCTAREAPYLLGHWLFVVGA